MAQNPEMRVSDRDRERVAEMLREHHAQGRLDLQEFQERLEDVYAKAKTYGDLQRLTGDLPEMDLYQLPVPAKPVTGSVARRNGLPTGMRVAWAVWGGVFALNMTIWLLVSITAGQMIYFWPMWVAGPWGAALLIPTLILMTRDGDSSKPPR